MVDTEDGLCWAPRCGRARLLGVKEEARSAEINSSKRKSSMRRVTEDGGVGERDGVGRFKGVALTAERKRY